jgi:hypothetical protein
MKPSNLVFVLDVFIYERVREHTLHVEREREKEKFTLDIMTVRFILFYYFFIFNLGMGLHLPSLLKK